MIHLRIDDQEIEVAEGRTILEACRENDIYIPTLCYHPALEPYGGCRLCVVELAVPPRKPRLVAACVYPCEEGVEVHTNTGQVQHSRRLSAELLMAAASDNPEIQAIASEMGVRDVRFKLPQPNDCVLCGLCVRACNEISKISAISVIQRGMAKKVSTPFQIISSRCISCGTCTVICPTGAFKLSEVAGLRGNEITAGLRRRYYHVGAELDLRPNFVEDVVGLLGSKPPAG